LNYTGVIGIVSRDNDSLFLLIKNKATGNVTFPGGGRDEGENDPLQTLHREVKEETGLRPSDYTAISTGIVHEFVYNSKKKERTGQKAVQPVYLVRTQSRKIAPVDPDSSVYSWLDPDGVLKALTFPDSKEIFRRVLEYLEGKHL
jgi:8-oxo-dGTP pyrophosphatase MutT (NUDIX family)